MQDNKMEKMPLVGNEESILDLPSKDSDFVSLVDKELVEAFLEMGSIVPPNSPITRAASLPSNPSVQIPDDSEQKSVPLVDIQDLLSFHNSTITVEAPTEPQRFVRLFRNVHNAAFDFLPVGVNNVRLVKVKYFCREPFTRTTSKFVREFPGYQLRPMYVGRREKTIAGHCVVAQVSFARGSVNSEGIFLVCVTCGGLFHHTLGPHCTQCHFSRSEIYALDMCSEFYIKGKEVVEVTPYAEDSEDETKHQRSFEATQVSRSRRRFGVLRRVGQSPVDVGAIDDIFDIHPQMDNGVDLNFGGKPSGLKPAPPVLEENVVGKFLSSLPGKIGSAVFEKLTSWAKSFVHYVKIGRDYAASLLSDIFTDSVRKTLKKAWNTAKWFLLSITAALLVGLAYKYRKAIVGFMDYVTDFVVGFFEKHDSLFGGFGAWLRSCYRHVFENEPEGPRVVVESVSKTEPNKQVLDMQSGTAALVATTAAIAGYLCETASTQKEDGTFTKFSRSIENVKKVCKVVTPLAAAFTIGSNAFQALFSFLPGAVQEALYTLFGITGINCSRGLRGAITRANNVLAAHASVVDGKNVLNDEECCNINCDRELARETVSAYIALNESIAHDLDLGRSKPMLAYVNHLSNKLSVEVEKSKGVLGLGSTRPEPVGLYMFGKSHVGKSSLVSILAAAVFPHAKPDELIFAKNVTDAFNSRYAQQLVYLIDDFGTAVGTPGATTTTQDMLRLISSTTASLNMASIADKGMAFTSKIVGLTTNVTPSDKIDGISNPEAFNNRFFFIEMLVAEDCANEDGSLDPRKARLDMSHHRFRLWEVREQQGHKRPMPTETYFDFQGLVDIVKGGLVYNEIRYYQKKTAEMKIREANKSLKYGPEESLARFRALLRGDVPQKEQRLTRKNIDGFDVGDEKDETLFRTLAEMTGKIPKPGEPNQVIDEVKPSFLQKIKMRVWGDDQKEEIVKQGAEVVEPEKLQFLHDPREDKWEEPEYFGGGEPLFPPDPVQEKPVEEEKKGFNPQVDRLQAVDVDDIPVGLRTDYFALVDLIGAGHRGGLPKGIHDEAKALAYNRSIRAKLAFFFQHAQSFMHYGKVRNPKAVTQCPFVVHDKSKKCAICKGPHLAYMCDKWAFQDVTMETREIAAWSLNYGEGIDDLGTAILEKIVEAALLCDKMMSDKKVKDKDQVDKWLRWIFYQILFTCSTCNNSLSIKGICLEPACEGSKVVLHAQAGEDDVEPPAGGAKPAILCSHGDCRNYSLRDWGFCVKHVGFDPKIVTLMSKANLSKEAIAAAKLTISTLRQVGEEEAANRLEAKIAMTGKPDSKLLSAYEDFMAYQKAAILYDMDDKCVRAANIRVNQLFKLSESHGELYFTRRWDERSWWQCAKDWFIQHPNVAFATKCVAGIVTAAAVVGMIGWMAGLFAEDVEPQYSWERDKDGNWKKSYRENWIRRGCPDVVEEGLKGRDYGTHYHSQCGEIKPEVPSSDELQVRSFRRNMVKIVVHGKDRNHFIWGVSPGGSQVVAPLHVFMQEDGNYIDDGTLIDVSTNASNFSSRFEARNMTVFSDGRNAVADFCLYDFGLAMEPCKRILDKFATVEELYGCTVTEAHFLGKEDDSTMPIKLNCNRVEYTYSKGTMMGSWYLPKSWEYGPKEDGDCGKLLVVKVKGQFKIVGYHIASKRKYTVFSGFCPVSGIGAALTRDLVEVALKRQRSVVVAQCGVEDENTGVIIHPEVKPLVQPREHVPKCDLRLLGFIPGRTFLNKNRFQWRPLPYLKEPWHTHEFYPAVTGRNHPLNPGHSAQEIFKLSFEKVHKSSEVKQLPTNIIDMCIRDVFDSINTIKPVREVRVMGMHEMVNGEGAMAGLSMNSAEGEPYNQHRPKTVLYPDGSVRSSKGKRWMFSQPDSEGNRTVTCEKLLSNLEKQDAQLRAGFIPHFLWTAILKDELRTVEKVMQTKTRIVIGSPVDLTMLTRKYFGSLLDHVYSNPISFGIAVGMNVFSSDWDRLMNQMFRVSGKGFDGDFSNFERYFGPQFAEPFLRNVEAWYDKWSKNPVADEERVARRTLLYCMMYAFLKSGDLVYKTWCLLLSGCYLTTLINSIMSNALSRMSFMMLALEVDPKHASMEHYRKLVSTITFGDDIMNAVSQAIKWFNAASMSRKLAEFNILFTVGSKREMTAADEELRDLTECEFLKQQTIVDKHRIPGVIYYPKSLEESLIKTLSYSNSELTVLEATIVDGNDVLGRAFGGGKEYFEMWRTRIWDCWRKVGITEIPLSYEDIKKRWIAGLIGGRIFLSGDEDADVAYMPNVEHCEWFAQSGTEEKVANVVPVEETKLVSLGDSTANHSIVGYDSELASVGTILKRAFRLYVESSGSEWISFPLGAPLVGTTTELGSNFMAPGLIRYFSQMYRLYSGNLRFHFLQYLKPTSGGQIVNVVTTSSDAVPALNDPWDGTTNALQNGAFSIFNEVGSVQAPYVTRYSVLKTPWFSGEVQADTSSGGTISFMQQTTTANPRVIMVAAADGFRMGLQCRIPSLMVVGNNYPHMGGSTVDVQEFIAFTLSATTGFEILLTQSDIDDWGPVRASTLPATGVANLTSFTVPSVDVPDSVLRSIGVPVPPGGGRNVLTGTTLAVTVKCPAGTITAVPYTITISSTPLMVMNDIASIQAVGSGTTYSFIDKWGVQNQLATTWITHDENWGSAYFRRYAGIPVNTICVANNDSMTIQVPMTAVYTTTPGYTVQRFCNVPIALGFGAPLRRQRGSRVEENKHDFEVVTYHPQSNTVPVIGGTVAVSSGGVNSKPNVYTMGEDVPSNIGVVSKEQLVDTLTWDTGSAAGACLGYYQAPFDLIISQVMKSAFSRYCFWRGDVTLRIQLQSNSFLCGSVILAWMPLCNSAQSLAVNSGNLRSLSVTRHVVLYAGASNTVDLKVPFVHMRRHLDLRTVSDDNTMGTFMLYVLNPLKAGPSATSTAATISVFASFENSDFAVINPTTVSIVPQGGIQSKVTNINIDKVVGSTLDASTTGDGFNGGATTMAPMDKPNIGLNYTPVIDRKYPMLANTTNIDYCEHLDTSANSRPVVKPMEMGTDQDEMSIKYLTQRLSYVDSFTVSASNTLGQAVYVGDLCPAFELFSMPVGASFTPTLLSYVSIPFSFWRGSLVYKFVAVASPVHTLRLQICSHIGFESAGLSVNEAFGQYTCIFEVRGVSEITISFPWRSPTEWKKVNTGSNSDTGNYSMGQFSVRVLNPLQAMEAVSASIDVNVYFAGGADYELAYLGNNAIDLVPVDSPM